MAVHRVTRQSGNKRISLQQRGSTRNTNNYAPRSRFLARCANRETAFKRSSSHKPLVGFVWRAGRQTSKHENKRANNGSEIIKRPGKQRFPRVTLKRWKKKNETRHESESRFLRVNFVIATEETTSFTIISFFISYFALQFFLCPTFHHPRSSFLLFVERIRFSVSYPLIPFSNVWFSPPPSLLSSPFILLLFSSSSLQHSSSLFSPDDSSIAYLVFADTATSFEFLFLHRYILVHLACHLFFLPLLYRSFLLLVFGHFFSRFLSFINLTLFFRLFYDSFSLQVLMRLGNDKSRM